MPGRSTWKLKFVALSLSMAVTDMCGSLFAPFFPGLALDSFNATNSQVGFVFAANCAAGIIVTPLVPCVIAMTGTRLAIGSGLFIEAFMIGSFSFMNRLPSTSSFLTGCIAIRALLGAASSVFETAATAAVMRIAPEHLAATAVGWAEAIRGVGALAGPVVGGLLYHIGGFELPFIVAGGSMLVLLPPLLLLLPPHDRAAQALAPPAPVSRLLRLPAVWAGTITIAVVLVAVSFLDPTLQPFLAAAPLRLSPPHVGLIFSASILSYVFASVISGGLAARIGSIKQLVLGVLLVSIGYILIGPAPFLSFLPPETTLALVLGGMLTIGLGGGLAYTPTNTLSLRSARAHGLSIEQASDGLAALVNLAFLVGSVIGPVLGGVLVELVGFRWASASFGLAIAVLPLMLGACLCREIREPPTEAVAAMATRLVVVVEQEEHPSCPVLVPAPGLNAGESGSIQGGGGGLPPSLQGG